MSGQGDIESTLRALIEHGPAMQAAGFSSVTLPNGLNFTLRAAAPAAPSGVAAPAPSDDDDVEDPDAELTAEVAEAKQAEKDWDAYWRRMTASSGAAIPAFPGIEKFRRMSALIAGRGH
jgi:hypothetical protein